MEDIIISWVQSIIDSITGLGVDGALSQGLQHYNPSIYQGVKSISSNITFPIGLSILALFVALEFVNISQRNNMNGLMGLEIPSKLILKFMICSIVLQNSFDILIKIFDLNLSIIQSISLGSNQTFGTLDIESFRKSLEDAGLFGQLGIAMQIFIFWVINSLSTLVVKVMVTVRMLELYLYLAICPIPIATLPSDEYGQIGKNFLKGYTAVALQGVLMFLILNFLTMLIGNIGSNDVYGTLWQCMFYSVIVAFALGGTSRLAKSICNAM